MVPWMPAPLLDAPARFLACSPRPMPSSHGRPGSPWLSFLPAGSPQIAPGLFPLVENTSGAAPPWNSPPASACPFPAAT
uniref:Uncharacterized protein n=1 Tax=Zea mays TaxID=4577 RepID=B6SK29_MAIZE|nr:hypothetical protein [Zea mays]ACG33620.1 hypothetical protein [Zea mays]